MPSFLAIDVAVPALRPPAFANSSSRTSFFFEPATAGVILQQVPFTLSLGLPPGKVLKVPARGRVTLVVKASFKEGVKPDVITLRPSRIPKEWKIETPPIAAGQSQTTITITTFGNKFVFPGQIGGLIITARMKVGKGIVSGFVPVIPYEVVRAQ